MIDYLLDWWFNRLPAEAVGQETGRESSSASAEQEEGDSECPEEVQGLLLHHLRPLPSHQRPVDLGDDFIITWCAVRVAGVEEILDVL